MRSVILLGLFLVLLFGGVPVAFALGISALFVIFLTGVPVLVVFQRMVAGVDSFTLLAIPFFILMGSIMGRGGIARRMVNFSNILIGRIRGGLSGVNVLASMFFAGISGSAVADTSSIGAMLIPMMVEEGYDREYSTAVTCTSSTIGLIIPPSNTLILFSFVAGGVSVAKLFAAGIIPGVLVGLGLLIVGYIISVRKKYPKHKTPPFKESLKIIREALLSLVIVVIIVGGILGGIFTATEAAVFGVTYTFLIAFFVYKEFKLRDVPKILLDAVYTTVIVMFMIATSMISAYILALEQVPQLIADTILSITTNQVLILIVMNMVLLIVGMVMDSSPAIIIFTPIFLPIVHELGMSSVQFGIMMLINLTIGLNTPPVGSVLFVGLAIAKTTMTRLFRPILTFLIPALVVLLLVTYVEPISMTIPNLLFRK